MSMLLIGVGAVLLLIAIICAIVGWNSEGRLAARVTSAACGIGGRPMKRPMESIIIIVRSKVLMPRSRLHCAG